jgi:hypothetical protein
MCAMRLWGKKQKKVEGNEDTYTFHNSRRNPVQTDTMT